MNRFYKAVSPPRHVSLVNPSRMQKQRPQLQPRIEFPYCMASGILVTETGRGDGGKTYDIMLDVQGENSQKLRGICDEIQTTHGIMGPRDIAPIVQNNTVRLRLAARSTLYDCTRHDKTEPSRLDRPWDDDTLNSFFYSATRYPSETPFKLFLRPTVRNIVLVRTIQGAHFELWCDCVYIAAVVPQSGGTSHV
jgi:hypothetical protein